VAAASSFAVFDASWWGVWWPWLLVWGITVGLLVTAVVIAVGHWRSDRARASTRLHGISFYLDNESVMDLFHQHGGKYRAALHQEVQERIIRNRKFSWSAAFAWFGGRTESDVSTDVVRNFIEKAEPITVIGIVIDVLDRADDIVNVDLRNQEVVSNRALDKALGADDARPTTVHLRDLNDFVDIFVSIRGRFRATGRTSEVTTLEAPYGEFTDGPQVHLACTTSGLRRTDVPTGTFPARCLGRVEDWNPDTRRLNVLPIAIFR
jgi:hypothetical protein